MLGFVPIKYTHRIAMFKPDNILAMHAPLYMSMHAKHKPTIIGQSLHNCLSIDTHGRYMIIHDQNYLSCPYINTICQHMITELSNLYNTRSANDQHIVKIVKLINMSQCSTHCRGLLNTDHTLSTRGQTWPTYCQSVQVMANT